MDLWGGWADAARTRTWERDSIVMPYSVTKPFAAVCVLRLADVGLVDLDAPMSTYRPDLRAPATVRQVLAHTAGVAVLEEPAPTEAFYDWDRMCALVADQEPQWAPGEGVGESALLYGHLLDEVVRRTDGRSLGRYLRDEVRGPHDLDFHVGLGDAELSRVVAGLYVALRHGRLLSDATLEEMLTPTGVGFDRVVGSEVSWGLGVGLDPDGWGMGGTGGSFWCWCEPGRYALGFVTGHVADHDRGDRVENAVRAVLGLDPA